MSLFSIIKKKLTGKSIDLTDVSSPLKAFIKMFPGIRNPVYASLERNQLTIDQILSFASGEIPPEIERRIQEAERLVQSDTSIPDDQKLQVLHEKYMPALLKMKDDYTAFMVKKLVYFGFGLVPQNYQAIVNQNMAKFGQTLDTLSSLVTGRASTAAYEEVTFGILVEAEKQLVTAFKFLDEQTGGKTTLNFRMQYLEQIESNVIMVDLNMLMPDNSTQQKSIHLPEVGKFIMDTLANVRAKEKRDAEQLLLDNNTPNQAQLN